MRSAPLGTARDRDREAVHAVTNSIPLVEKAEPAAHGAPFLPTRGHVARLEAAVLERASLDHSREARTEVAAAISRAEQGKELSILDFDFQDPSQRAVYDRALTDVREERARRDRAAATLLAFKWLHGRVP